MEGTVSDACDTFHFPSLETPNYRLTRSLPPPSYRHFLALKSGNSSDWRETVGLFKLLKLFLFDFIDLTDSKWC